jgi:hypothetical protein
MVHRARRDVALFSSAVWAMHLIAYATANTTFSDVTKYYGKSDRFSLVKTPLFASQNAR